MSPPLPQTRREEAPMEGVTMSRKELGHIAVFSDLKRGTMTQSGAAAQLGLSLRQVQRKWSTYKKSDYDPASLVHKLRGRASNRRLDERLVSQAVELVTTQYPDFGPTFAAEKLAEDHAVTIGRERLRQALIAAGVWTVHGQHRPIAHPWRKRRAVRGELVQLDGSPHRWFEDHGEACTLLAFIDDATSEVLWLEFVESETTDAVMRATGHYLEVHGRPGELYTDRGGVFKVNLHNEDDDKVTQYKRALAELDIGLIHARSPQAKGRVERGFQTHQDRLVKELRLAGISTIAEANDFVRDVYRPKHNRKFAVAARQAGDAHRSLAGYDLDTILCTKEERTVTNDLTIRYQTRWFQLTPQQRTIVRPKHVVTVSEHLDGRISLLHGRTTLDFTEIWKQPARPQPVMATQRAPRVPYKPAPDHPWRTYPLVTVLHGTAIRHF